MKFIFSKLVIALLVVCAFANAFAQKEKNKHKDVPDDEDKSVATVTTAKNVAVIYCGGTGRVYVRGWDKPEVRAVGEEGSKIKITAIKNNEDVSAPASQIEVQLRDGESKGFYVGQCQNKSNIELYVPRGASVDLRTQHGDITAEKIAKAKLRSVSGSFSIRDVNGYVQVSTSSGDISLDNSSGSISLNAFSGSIDVRNVKSIEAVDSIGAVSLSGDVTLENVSFLRVEGNSTSGDVTFFGSLTKGSTYHFRSTSGDVTTVLPATSSFKVTAFVSHSGEIICDFPIAKPTTNKTMESITRLVGTHGTGDSTLVLTSVNGTVHLRKK